MTTIFSLGWIYVLGFFLLFSSAAASWIDIDTPIDKRTTTSFVDGTTYELVMSDEFNVENRTFKDGDDPMWTALDKPDNDANAAGGGSLHFYNSSAVRTSGGMLEINTYTEKTSWHHYDTLNKEWRHIQTNFTSGMVQSWNKFCFTGGIVEVDLVLPGDPAIGGLWPAVWMLGNLGRATYEASTNLLWPWSYDVCDREKQDAQKISACNQNNHYGMHPFQGRGATEIDIAEVMTGNSNGPLPGTNPPIALPYCDMTLQVAPGVPKNRPQSGSAPIRKKSFSKTGHTEFAAETWYEGLEMRGNTSINPFFYGTYLDVTKPNEPVTRTEKQAYQADAIGVAHQLTDEHFQKPHTFRIEWQPGSGGRIDWYVKGGESVYVNETEEILEMDGKGTEWIHVFSLKDESLSELTGSQIPVEPTYLILNTAISSSWGFPYDAPDYCPKCYDCNDAKCACRFYPGFCRMLAEGVKMRIDSIRVYQSRNDKAHVGSPHTLGCDPPEYPTKEWIIGHEYQYMRGPPFDNKDEGPLRRIRRGGGDCTKDKDCGGYIENLNLTALYEMDKPDASRLLNISGRGYCSPRHSSNFFSGRSVSGGVCRCREGFTGPQCLSIDHWDNFPSAYKLDTGESPFRYVAEIKFPGLILVALTVLAVMVLYFVCDSVSKRKKLAAGDALDFNSQEQRPLLYKPGKQNKV